MTQSNIRTIHSVVQIPICEGPIGTSLPFLFTHEGEVSLLALAWARSKKLEEHASSATVADGAAALGRFLDYCHLVHKGDLSDPKRILLALKRFHEARRFGCPQLGWQATRESTAAADVRLVSEFSDWSAMNFVGTSINPVIESDFSQLSPADRAIQAHRTIAKKRWDFFAHLASATKEGRGTLLSRLFSPPNRRKKSSDNKHFPVAKVDALIENTTNIRDKLFFLLLFYGGLRISEPLHLFTRDVTIEPDGIAKVILAHPQDGSMNWIDAANRQRRGARMDYLADRYGLGPRNVLPEDHPKHAGWKGILLEDAARSESEVHWLDESKGRLFARLHSEYVRTLRSHLPDDNPYYFCSFHRDAIGEPLTVSNITKSFYRASARVGLHPSDEGVHPHGARHFYGYYCASVMRLSIEVTQRLMHHEDISSTENYYSLDKRVVRNELKKGQLRARQARTELPTT